MAINDMNNVPNVAMDYEATRAAYQSINNFKKKMEDIIENTKMTMVNSTDPSTNEGKQGVALQNSFMELTPKFDQCFSILDQLLNTLSTSISNYEAFENEEAKKAEDLP